MAARQSPIDAYLAALSDEQRGALARLRKLIQAAVPRAEECISYGLPAFRQDGPLVGFGAGSSHCALYPFSGHTVAEFQKELRGYDVSKGTIRFQPDRPLPAALVRKIVRARLAENKAAARRQAK